MSILAAVFGIMGVAMALLAIAVLLLRHKSPLIFDKYPRKGLFYHLKYGIALLVLRHLRHKFYHSIDAKQPHTQPELATWDRPQPLTDDPKSYDVVSFIGANKRGEKLMVTVERRRCGVLKAALYLWLPERGLLCSPKLPDMMHFTTDGGQENAEFRGSGFHIYPEQCMRVWRILYAGEMREVSTRRRLHVKLDLKFSSQLAHFNYNRDLSSSVVADSIAREAWNDAFYNMLKSVDQILEKRTHYEQNGTLIGEVRIETVDSGDGEEDVNGAVKPVALRMRGFRDHSFGTERCLSTINRYVYFALFLDDGTSMVVGILSQPSFFLSSLKVGYVCTRDGLYKPITKCNFELYTYGERGTPPQHKNFNVYTADADYFVQIQADDSALRYVGRDWESKVYNQFVTCTVNGVRGQGLTEYLYRNAGGRPTSVSCKDPEWFQRVRNFERSLSTGEHLDDSEEFVF